MGKRVLRVLPCLAVLMTLTVGLSVLFAGCGKKNPEKETTKQETEKQEENSTHAKADYLKEVAETLLYNTDNVRGNLDLVATAGKKNEVTVEWTSSDPAVITDQATGENGKIPAGVVTRGEKDQTVTLTATLRLDKESFEKQFDVTVVKKPEEKKYEAYVYTYFQANINGTGESQHIHMATSKDGFFWSALNDNQPILRAEKGTKGVRDSYLIRSPEGDRFYLIGTDLDANGGDWGAYGGNGSRYIRVWESDDLVSWSEERLIEIAPENAACMWAPETTYDPTTGEYIVYWASGLKGGAGKHIWYAKTRDFYHFSEPKVYKPVDGDITYIDTTMTEYNGTYYRFTKNENEISIFLETSDAVLGDFTLVKTRIANEFGVEGPAIYRINGEEKWILYMDGYTMQNGGVGYFPLIAENEEALKKGEFRRLDATEYQMPIGAKHGSFVPITMDEYKALNDKYGSRSEEYPEDNENAVGCILSLDMTVAQDGKTLKDTSGQGNDGVITGNADVKDGAFHFDGSTFVTLPEGMFDGQNYLTINLWCKNETGSGNYAAMFFGSKANPPESYWLFLPANPDGRMKSVFTNTVNKGAPWGTEAGFSGGGSGQNILGPVTDSEWNMYTTVITPDSIAAYYNGTYLGKRALMRTVSDFGENLVAYLGKSSYPDVNFKGYLDNVSVYDHVLTKEDVETLYKNGR